MNKIAVYLNRHLTGNVFDKDSILEAYSTDRSLLKVKPRFVALPESTSDVRKLVKFVSQLSEKKYNLPIAIRGSGLSKTGADLSSGLVLSMEKLSHVRELDAHDRLIHVQAGITLGKLNAILAPHGLTLPVAADPRETLGSLIANAPIDKYSNKYRGIMTYVDRVEVVLSNGDLLQTSRLGRSRLASKQSETSFEGEIYKKLSVLLEKQSELVESTPASSRLGYPALKHIRRVNGKVFDLLPAFFGSEGNLGVITEVILRLEVLPPHSHRLFAVFSTYKSAREFADFCLKLSPLSVELFDTRLFKSADAYGKKPSLLSKKFDDGFLVLVGFNDKSHRARRRVRQCLRFLPKSAYVVSETVKNSPEFNEFEAALLAVLSSDAKGERPFLLDDFYLPRAALPEFLKDLHKLEKSSKRPLELFGSYATEIFSLRPTFDLSKLDERRAALTLLQSLNELLKTHGGSLIGGSPEGRLKSIIVYPELDKKSLALISDVKKIFDPRGVFAPETKSAYDTRSAVRHLRTEPLPGPASL